MKLLDKYHVAISWLGLVLGLLLLLGVGVFSDTAHRVFLFVAVVLIFAAYLVQKLYPAPK